jgi:hypothetical protein
MGKGKGKQKAATVRGDAPSPNNSKKVLGGPVESSTVGVAAATSNTVGCIVLATPCTGRSLMI